MNKCVIMPALFLFLLLSSCSTIEPAAPEMNLMAIEVQDVTLSHVNLFADLRLYNPNAVKVSIKGVEYSLFLNGVRISKGRSGKTLAIEPESYGNINLRMSSAYWDIFQFINKMQTGEEIRFQLIGKVIVGGYGIFGRTFDFDKEGMIPLAKKSGSILEQ